MTSFYLKYRPQRIEDLDLKSVRDFFRRVISSGKISHAYLFAGPKGTGKTSAARILAKIVNCTSSAKATAVKEPCNKCDNCLAITAGNFPDLIEIDAASNRGIDDIRTLKETVGLVPLKGSYKVYLVDEVHMLTMEAFNALLKTLEEPPRGVVFILATTDPDKLPETVVSRCTRVNFGRAEGQEIARSLEKIIKAEKLKVKPEAVEKIAQMTEGSFRDAQKALEQIVMGREKEEITADVVEESFGIGKNRNGEKLLTWLIKGDARLALMEIEALEKAGVNFKNLIMDLIERLRLVVLARVGVETNERMAEGLDSVTLEEAKALLEKLVKAGEEIKQAMITSLPLELMVVEWCGDSGAGAVGARIPSPRQARGGVRLRSQSPSPASLRLGKSKVKFEDVQAKWQEVLGSLRPKNHSLAGLLRSARPVAIEKDALVIEVFYQFHLDQLKQERYRRMMEETLNEVFAFPMGLEYILGQKPHFAPSTSLRATGGTAREDNAVGDDEEMVKAAEEVFGGE